MASFVSRRLILIFLNFSDYIFRQSQRHYIGSNSGFKKSPYGPGTRRNPHQQSSRNTGFVELQTRKHSAS